MGQEIRPRKMEEAKNPTMAMAIPAPRIAKVVDAAVPETIGAKILTQNMTLADTFFSDNKRRRIKSAKRNKEKPATAMSLSKKMDLHIKTL